MIEALLLLIFSNPVFAGQFVHLGAPPSGTVLVEIKSVHAVASVYVSGTLNPPALQINGKPVETFASESATDSQRLKINGKEYPVSGTNGRFFIELKGAEAAVSELVVELGHAKGKNRASLFLGRLFFEAPIDEKREISDQDSATVPLVLSGTVPKGYEIYLGGQKFPVSENGQMTITLDIKTGESSYNFAAVDPSGVKRVIEIKLQRKDLTHDERRAVLSLKTDEKGDLPFSGNEIEIAGVTNRGAKLKINDQSVSVGWKGKFSTDVAVTEAQGPLNFEVVLPGGQTETLSYQYNCPECTQPRKARSWGLSLGGNTLITLIADSLPGKVMTSYNSLGQIRSFAVSYQHQLVGAWSVNFRGEHIGWAGPHEDDRYGIETRNLDQFSGGISYQAKRFLTYEFALAYLSGRLDPRNFTLNQNSASFLGLSFGVTGQIKLSQRWFYQPRFSIGFASTLPGGLGLNAMTIGLEMLSFGRSF